MLINEDLLKDLDKDSFSKDEVALIHKYNRKHNKSLLMTMLSLTISLIVSNYINLEYKETIVLFLNICSIGFGLYSACILGFLRRKLSRDEYKSKIDE